MDYDFLRLSPMLVLIMSLGMIIPSRSISVGVIEGSDEELTLPEYDDTREKGLNTAQGMRTSCELKDKYLPGTLPGNRLPSFASASDAFESCKSERDCLGMTYVPKKGKWELRSSSEPRESSSKEVSLTKECVDAIGLPRFTVEGKRHCYDTKQQQFESFEEATNACKDDDSCAGIWDDKCDGTKFWTCENQRDWDEFSQSSCIYRKNSEKSIYDVMQGDQPPEERMNAVNVEKETTNSCAPSCTKCEPMIDMATERWCLRQCNKEPIDCPKDLCKCF